MSPRTIDVPELSTIEPTETLTQWRRRTHPRKRRWLTTLHTFVAFRN